MLPVHSPHLPIRFATPPRREHSELQRSPRIASIALVIIGFIAALAVDLSMTQTRAQGFLFVLLCYAFAGMIELAWYWRPHAGRWVAVVLTTLVLPIGGTLLGSTSFLVLLPVPVILAVALLGIGAGSVVAVSESVLVAFLIAIGGSPLEVGPVITTLLSVWATLGLLIAIYLPALRIEESSRQHVLRARELLDEARDRNADLDRVLDDLVHVNRQLDLANERLAAARTIAEEARRSKSMFVAKVSHELRTPLNMIIGLSDFLLKQVNRNGETVAPDILKDVQIINRNSEHLARMINDVLDLSQTEAGQLVLHRQWVDMPEEIRDAAAVVKPLFDKKMLDLEVVVQENLPKVFCDPIRIRQVLLNLISNAGRHTQSGYVRIEAKREGRYASISVSDTGSGISEQDLAQVFEPFYQESQSAAAQGLSSGLGLTVSKQFIEQHNGSIWAESELGRGSTFAFRLPLNPLSAPVASASGWISEDWIWKERHRQAALPSLSKEWRVIVCDESGRIYPLLSKFIASEIELVETQSIAQVVSNMKDMPAHMVVFHDEDPASLDSILLEARSVIPDTPLVGCALPLASTHRETPDVADYLIKPVTRADLRDAIETLSTPVNRVLVIDDDADVRDLFTRLLHDLNSCLEITTAADGDEALLLMRKERFDLLLLDIIMPNRNGWGVLEEKQKIPHMCDAPVLIMSAQDPDVKMEDCILFAMTTGEGVPVEFMLENAFRLASRLLKPTATPGQESQGIPRS